MITINPTESPYIINNFLNWYCQKIQSQCALTYNLIFKIALTIGLQRKTINFRVKIKIAMQHLSADIRSIWDQSWGNRFRKKIDLDWPYMIQSNCKGCPGNNVHE